MPFIRNEAGVKDAVKKVLAEMDAMYPQAIWWFMPSANGYGRAGIPDFVGVVNGHGFVIETKFGPNQLTAHQIDEIVAFGNAGGRAFVVRESTLDGFKNEFRGLCALSCN